MVDNDLNFKNNNLCMTLNVKRSGRLYVFSPEEEVRKVDILGKLGQELVCIF